MIKKHYTGMERRAENIIWNAAGQYDFDPPFMAFTEKGQPDLYYNMVIGLTIKWLDMPRLTEFFNCYAASHKADEFDDILWLGIENCVYEKEFPQRPVIKNLRRQKAEQFYKNRETLSRQQMMLQSMPVYDQQQARWSAVLGRKGDFLSPKEQKLAEALKFSGDLDTSGVIRNMQAILQKFFHYTVPAEPAAAGGSYMNGRKASLLKRILHREDRYRDTLIVRNGDTEGDQEGAAQIARGIGEQKSVHEYETDLAYIRGALGESVVSEKELRTLENNLCKGDHADCRLWVTAGIGSNDNIAGRSASDNSVGITVSLTSRDASDLARVQKDSAQQAGRNRAWMKEHAQLLTSSIRRLTARVDEVLSSYEQALPEESKAGRLRADIAYRLPVLQDPDVFLRAGEETERSVSVDLLLDASASRLNYQEQLAAEATIIAKSLIACRVPVQVECFRSLRGFTVLQILKDRNSHDCSHIADYFAGGWNRDGLGLRLAEEFLPESRDTSTRILLTLTDASPNDSTRVPPDKSGILEREYQGRTAVLDTKQAVDELKKNGVKIGAIFLGPTLYMENLHTIYGTDAVRIHRVEQLEEATATLLDQILREQTAADRKVG